MKLLILLTLLSLYDGERFVSPASFSKRALGTAQQYSIERTVDKYEELFKDGSLFINRAFMEYFESLKIYPASP